MLFEPSTDRLPYSTSHVVEDASQPYGKTCFPMHLAAIGVYLGRSFGLTPCDDLKPISHGTDADPVRLPLAVALFFPTPIVTGMRVDSFPRPIDHASLR
jgi:hypothetical protein